MAYPYKGRFQVSQTFLNRNTHYTSGYHLGIDLVGLDNEKRIYPIRSGIVYSITSNDAFGNSVVVKMDNGLYCRYSHLSKISVNKNQRVSEGLTQIGIEGDTGSVYGYGDLRHLDLRISKYPYHTNNTRDYINPAEFLGFPNILYYTVTQKGDKMEHLIIANNEVDKRAAEYLADYLKAPIISRENATSELLKYVNKIYEIGGSQYISGSIHISGSNRFDTARKVLAECK